MRQTLMAAAMSSAALIAGYGTASAQLAIETPAGGVYVGPTYHNDYYYEPYGPRVYGYYESDRGYRLRDRQSFRDRQKCGRRAYWDGQTCLPGFRP